MIAARPFAGLVFLTLVAAGCRNGPSEPLPARDTHPARGEVDATLRLAGRPHGVTVAANGTFYVSQIDGDAITRGTVGPGSQRFTGTGHVGATPAHVAIDPAGRTVRDALGDTPFARCLHRAVEAGVPVSRQEVVQELAGEPLVIGLTTVPLTDEDSRILGVIALFADLTPVRQLEQRLRDMQTLADLGEISAGIAHEFRNSLSTILGYLKLAGRDLLPEETQKRLRNAEEEATLLSGAVEGLLSFARPMRLEFHETDLADLVRGVVDRFIGQQQAFPITVDLEPATVQADPTLLSRAIENLIRNAVESVRQKGAGAVDVSLEGGTSPVLRIADSGVGLDPQEAPRLLLPFQSDKPDGMGLGLPLARKIIMLHGGNLQLSGEPGAGAVVTVTFGAEGAPGAN